MDNKTDHELLIELLEKTEKNNKRIKRLTFIIVIVVVIVVAGCTLVIWKGQPYINETITTLEKANALLSVIDQEEFETLMSTLTSATEDITQLQAVIESLISSLSIFTIH